MRIIPVMDVMGGAVVRGVGGRREEYRPIVSALTGSSQPADVALAFRAHYGLSELYVADLDAIAGRPLNRTMVADLAVKGFQVWVDAGVRTEKDAEDIAMIGANVVLGLETLMGPEVVAATCEALGDRVLFSLDMKAGRLLGQADIWRTTDPEAVADLAASLSVRRLLVLDLARVGMAGGCGTEDLCARLAAGHPEIELWAGGGVRDRRDLDRLKRSGVQAALVASALHDRTLGYPGRHS